MAFCVSYANSILNCLCNGGTLTSPGANLFLSLHTAVGGPSATDPHADEIAFTAQYARKQVSFANAANKNVETDAAYDFLNMPAVTVRGVAIWDSATLTTADHCIATGTFGPVTLADGNTLHIDIGGVDFTLDPA